MLTRLAVAAVFLLLLVALSADARQPRGGTIVGVVKTDVRARQPIRVAIDPAVCGDTVPDESIVVDRDGGVTNAVVTVAGVKVAASAEAGVVNEGCRFAPRVSVLRPGGQIRMMSKDAVLHTMHAVAIDGRPFFNLSLPIQNVTASRPLPRPGVVTLSCSTHTWMRGYVHVTGELATVSGIDGSFRLEGVPAGEREVRIWHEALRASPLRVVVKEGETSTIEIRLGS